ncbi:MAG: hypothetical protein LRY55_01410 [Leadbetterella sp.]|nr:hypothetical protein [Leadbetterella sp.]
MMKRTKIWAVVGLLLTFTWSYGQSIDQVVKDLDAERYTAALDGANKLVVSSPGTDTYFLKGYTILSSPGYAKAENLKAAREAFEAGNALEKKGDPLNQVGLGMVKLASKDLAGAKAIFEEVKKETKSRNADILYRIAEAYVMFPEANDPAEAILTIDLALDKHKTKDNPEYYLVKADAYLLKGDGGNAMNALQNAERVGKKPAKTYSKIARVWLQSRNYKDALEAIDKGVSADPSHAPIYKYQSSYWQTFSDYAKSAQAAANYLKNSDGDVNAKLRYAKLAFVAKDFVSLKRVLSEIKGSSNDPYIHRMEGIVNFNEGRYKESIEDFKTFLKADAKDENFSLDYGYIGKAYLKMEGDSATTVLNDSLGILNIDKAVALQDTTSDANYYGEAAAILLEKKNYAKSALLSEKEFKAKKEPDASDYARVGMNFYRARNWSKASEFLTKAGEEYKGAWPVAYVYGARATVYQYREDSTMNAQFPAAPLYIKYLESLGDAGKADPANKETVVEAIAYLSTRDLMNKDYEAGLAKIEEVLKYAPDNKDATDLYHRFKNCWILNT